MAGRKKRVRQHVIADMSFHHVAYHVVRNGFTIEAIASDYGYDGWVVTFNANGEVENGLIYIQLKATDKIIRGKLRDSVEFRVDKRDLDLWGDEPFPVYLVVFDATSEEAYWVYFQQYVQEKKLAASRLKAKSLVVVLDKRQQVNAKVVAGWRDDKARVLAQISGVRHA